MKIENPSTSEEFFFSGKSGKSYKLHHLTGFNVIKLYTAVICKFLRYALECLSLAGLSSLD